MKKIILPKDHYSLEHLAQFIMGATHNFCTRVQHCLVLLRVTWRDTNSCKQQSNQCPICYYGPLTWTYVATSFTLCQASARGHESPRKGPIFWGRKMKKEKSCHGKNMACRQLYQRHTRLQFCLITSHTINALHWEVSWNENIFCIFYVNGKIYELICVFGTVKYFSLKKKSGYKGNVGSLTVNKSKLATHVLDDWTVLQLQTCHHGKDNKVLQRVTLNIKSLPKDT